MKKSSVQLRIVPALNPESEFILHKDKKSLSGG